MTLEVKLAGEVGKFPSTDGIRLFIVAVLHGVIFDLKINECVFFRRTVYIGTQ